MSETKAYLTLSARAALEHVVEVLNTGNHESERLWDILTALRGPDNGNEVVKSLTTSRIRRVIGLVSSLMKDGNFIRQRPGPSFGSANVDISDVRPLDPVELFEYPSKPFGIKEKYGRVDDHFLQHLKMAIIALRALGYDTGKEPDEIREASVNRAQIYDPEQK